MTYLLVRVSGVAMLEQGLKDTKTGYQDYIERTSAFIPWFPKRTPEADR
jgi:steroid 5-alpha reductase family enzyme